MTKPSSEPMARSARNALRNQRGQALIEAAIVILMLTTLFMGVTEFGRAWMVGNMITQAARAGSRMAAVAPTAQRTNGTINNSYKDTIKTFVKDQIRGVLDNNTVDNALTVNVTQGTAGAGIPTVSVQVTGNIDYIFRFMASTFAVSRSVTFRDEGA